MLPDPKRVESIFAAAAAITSAERRAIFLDAACGNEAHLRARIEALLSAHGEAGEFLEAAALTAGLAPITEGPGTLIGPYKLLQKIGEGGMGIVYMAEQQEPVRRKVALKIIKPGMDSREVIARFEAERQALAMMDHLNIAKVLEAGTTAGEPGALATGGVALAKAGEPGSVSSGRPYFVMELVHGVSLTKYCDDNKLTPRQRLELFIPVCQAVQHAHQKGIIHRDIKPSNVMVTMYDDKPVPKIIDFGVAKAVEQRLTEKSLFTQYGAMVGTFEYMSPEQAELNAFGVDTRSDIYSLGVLLYELLTGTTPLERQRLREAAYGEIVRLIKEEEPVRPSMRLSTSGAALACISRERGTEPARLAKLVRGDLDWIVMRCLEKDRARRYETATGLAQDIQHYLAEEPVLACPPSAWYRFRKMARRNKAAMTTAALVAATLLMGFVVSAWQAVRATNAEARALTAAADAQKNAQVARDNLDLAAQEKQNAIDQARIAEKERVQADIARKQAQKNESESEWRLYASNIGSAQREWEVGSSSLLYHYLTQARPSFRGWEHDHLYSVANPGLLRVLRGFTKPVQVLAFSPNGKFLATACGDSIVHLWDRSSGQLVKQFEAPTKRVLALAFSPDGRSLACGGGDSLPKGGPTQGDGPAIVTCWDVAGGHEIRRLRESAGCFVSVCFSPDGTRLASALLREVRKPSSKKEGGTSVSSTGVVQVWDLRSGNPEVTVSRLVHCVVFSPDGDTIACAVGNDAMTMDSSGRVIQITPAKIRVLDAKTGKERLSVGGETVPGSGLPNMEFENGNVAFSPDGARIASGQYATVKVWTVADGRESLALEGHTGRVQSVAFSPDGNLIATASSDKTVRVWDAATGRELRTLKGHSAAVNSIAFSHDSKCLATAGLDKTLRLWDTAGARGIRALELPLALEVRSVAFSADGKGLAAAVPFLGGRGDPKDRKNQLRYWDVSTAEIAWATKTEGSLKSVSFSPDGRQLAAAGGRTDGGPLGSVPRNGTLTVWDRISGKEVVAVSKLEKALLSVAYSPDGGCIATGSADKNVKLWHPASGKLIRNLQGHEKSVTSVAFSPDGKLLASASADNTVKIWELSSGRAIETLPGLSSGDRTVAFSPDSKLLAVASSGNTVRFWDTATGKQVLVLKGHTGAVTSLAFIPDGLRLATGSADGTVKLWDAISGQELLTLRGHSGKVTSVAFSRDGKQLAGATMHAIIIWDASKSMKELEQK